MFIKIGQFILNTNQIISINLDAVKTEISYAANDTKDFPCVMVTTTEINGEFGHMHNGSGSWQPHTHHFFGDEAEAIRKYFEREGNCVVVAEDTATYTEINDWRKEQQEVGAQRFGVAGASAEFEA